MKPETMSNSTEFRWNSPTPYLYGSLAAMFGLITMVLLVLACSYRRAHDNSHPTIDISIKQTAPAMEPTIVVIMAGDNNPTFLAEPITSIHK
ncbi:protein GLUTAMINE DUMPER 2-like protein [Cinnamomum micranthum f. kanehirae]|uniref:Protein GLUTAMINE DUMPER 2-like protein n=1 Tax=Cinnamomum micranthum f. kanehirae TaxID=337451 RepID=A0A443NXU7_9MAGN|nr:protein GLUTAMINE DUMPER 2-like protein [Cinnamomum micranthum f. kanehirae]